MENNTFIKDMLFHIHVHNLEHKKSPSKYVFNFRHDGLTVNVLKTKVTTNKFLFSSAIRIFMVIITAFDEIIHQDVLYIIK